MRDIDIRCALIADMERRHRDEANTRIVQELGLRQGLARVDVAVVNGRVHGYEIKSAHDTLARLPSQVSIYNQTLDYVTIVAAQSHLDKIIELVPSWWEIQVAVQSKDGLRLKRSRRGRRNPQIDPFAFAQLLWRNEALDALRSFGLDAGMHSKPRRELWRRLATELTAKQLGNVVRESLKKRGPAWGAPLSQA